jgi:predicted regulator of amino acid metabolism with ACT domain
LARAIRIRVGASIDPSLRTVFKPFEVSAEQAARKVRASFDGATKGTTKSAQTNVTRAVAANKAYADALRMIEKSRADHAIAQQQRSTRAAMRAFDEKLRASKKARDAEERDILSTAKADDRKRERAANRRAHFRESAFRDFGNRAVSNVGSLARGAVGVGSEVARGVGIDSSISGTLSRNVELERLAVALSNQGVNVVEGKSRVDPKQIESKIKQVADAAGMNRLDVGQGIGQMIARTGDLETTLSSMDQLAKLAKVADASFADMAGAAGEVSNALGDMPAEQKTKAIADVMNTLAAQGKLGAVEIKDLASQFGKLGAAGTRFQGDRAENLKLMGGLVQMARKYGGAPSAREAATSIMGMANTFATPARVAAFKRSGISVFDKKTGLIRSPTELIMESLAKTKGDPTKFKKLFANVIGAKPAEAMAGIFRTERAAQLASGASAKDATAAGLAKARAELEQFSAATIDATEFADSFAASMNTTASKAQQAQNRLDDISGEAAERLLPAFQKMLPTLESVANGFAGIVTWAAENPGKAIVAALVGSIAKAGIETAVSKALGAIVSRAFSGGAAGAAGGAGLGTLGQLGVITLTAATVYLVGRELIDEAVKQREGAIQSADDSLTGGQLALTNARVSSDAAAKKKADLERALAENERQLGFAAAKRESSYDIGIGRIDPSFALAAATGGLFGKSQGQVEIENAATARESELKQQNAELKAELAGIKGALSKTLNVNVQNLPAGGMTADPSGRVGPLSMFPSFFMGG